LCPSCAEWNAPAAPVRLFGNAYYVGTRGLSAILLTSSAGHILLDAGLPESASQIFASIRALGFRVEDIKLLVNSHAHYDHAGGLAALQRASRAVVAAREPSAVTLRRGSSGPDDPQYGIALSFPSVSDVRLIGNGDTLRVGPIMLTAHATAGHTPGGTTWSWSSCDDGQCLDFVYADSQTPVSADGFSFTRSATYPLAVQDFERGFGVLERLPCDVLVTPHPDASRLWERLEARARGIPDALRDPEACRRYAANARQRLARRIAAEAAAK
jgi:metallo-beta-lactamase class B